MGSEVIVIWDWDADTFHRRVQELESNGYVALKQTYRVTAEVHPETGEVTHLRTIEMVADSPHSGEQAQPAGTLNSGNTAVPNKFKT